MDVGSIQGGSGLLLHPAIPCVNKISIIGSEMIAAYRQLIT